MRAASRIGVMGLVAALGGGCHTAVGTWFGVDIAGDDRVLAPPASAENGRVVNAPS